MVAIDFLDKFSKKWKKFSTDGIHKLLVIADFDYTLTPFLNEQGHFVVLSIYLWTSNNYVVVIKVNKVQVLMVF
jgi:hypothetical protein